MPSTRALVVDDSPTMRRSIVYALQRIEGLVCVEAQDGADGLKKFAADQYDILITDINMPLMDGLKLISLVRQDPKGKLPIVVITTESAAADRAKAIDLGANAYLVKPIQAQLVVDTVKGLLSAR